MSWQLAVARVSEARSEQELLLVSMVAEDKPIDLFMYLLAGQHGYAAWVQDGLFMMVMDGFCLSGYLWWEKKEHNVIAWMGGIDNKQLAGL